MSIMSFRYNLRIDLAAALGPSISAFRSVRPWIPVEPDERSFSSKAETMQNRNSHFAPERGVRWLY
jgi:hypothetical protein